MNSKQITAALKLELVEIKNYSARLAKVFTLLKDLKKLPGYKATAGEILGNVDMVRNLIEPSQHIVKKHYRETKDLFGWFQNWQIVTIEHETGNYSVYLPAGTSVQNEFLIACGIPVMQTITGRGEKITLPASILPALKKAASFAGKDPLRHKFMNVLFEIRESKLQLIATDCHKLYMSEKFDCSYNGEMDLLIPAKTVSEVAKLKIKDSFDMFVSDNEIHINGRDYDKFTWENYPDYKQVIPELKASMEFEKDLFVQSVKSVVKSANQSTKETRLHLNGSISMHCQDIDFGFSADADMPYINKGFPDLDISFNGEFLLDTMSVFKSKTVKMYHSGKNNTASVFTDGNETILLMPICR